MDRSNQDAMSEEWSNAIFEALDAWRTLVLHDCFF